MHIVESLLRVALFGSEWVMYVLIALSVASFSAMFERWLFFRRHGRPSETLREQLARTLGADDLPAAEQLLANDRSVVAKVVAEALRFRGGGAEAVSDAADSELGRVRPELERGLNLLGTLGNNAPFVGLFGTVIGVIQAFAQLGTTGNKAAAMGNVMNGIAEALVATGVGIFVALPAVVAYNVAQKRIGELENEALSLVKLVTAYVKTQASAGVVRPLAERANAAGSAKPTSADSSAARDAVRQVTASAGGE